MGVTVQIRNRSQEMKKYLIATAIALSTAVPAHAGKGDLQLQIQAISNVRYVEVFVSIKNRTNTDYAQVVWSCSFWDREDYLIGRDVPIVFFALPYQSLRYEPQAHPEINGMPHRASCKFIGAEERTRENTRLYTSSPRGVTLPIDSGQWWHPEWNAYTQPMETSDVPKYKRYQNGGGDIPTETAESVRAANEKFKAEHPLGKPSSINEQCRRMETENPKGAAENIACQELKAGRKIPGLTNYE
jgi:hypothetical protein